MKIVIAPDSFKESASSAEVAASIHRGFARVFPDAEIIDVPIADGGEGTFAVLTKAAGGQTKTYRVTGPDGRMVEAEIGYSADMSKAFIEMAAASGLHLVPAEARNPLRATSFGTGELIAAALDAGVQEIVLGIGGSATNDGGAGMAMALGAQLLDGAGRAIGYGGGALAELATVDAGQMHPRLATVRLVVACDVENPLLGSAGATYVYGAQKGADAAMQAELEAALSHYADVLSRSLGRDVRDVAGSGAAGGLGAGLLWFTPAELRRGIDVVLEQVGLAAICADADVVITGEGRMDAQTVFGKAPVGVAKMAPDDALVIAVCGALGENFEAVYEHGIDAAFSVISSAEPLPELLAHAQENIERTSEAIARVLAKKARLL